MRYLALMCLIRAATATPAQLDDILQFCQRIEARYRYIFEEECRYVAIVGEPSISENPTNENSDPSPSNSPDVYSAQPTIHHRPQPLIIDLTSEGDADNSTSEDNVDDTTNDASPNEEEE
ncbi:hypothetical protein DTO195F2_1370 [Paecilomyces variotii]|nr:hypothetical protein DTO195F2_1370 [Paecilomyces variotii]KAJ9307467.1 hypothetical protein DTO217A2_2939 [Paecilomyces variotii]